MDKIMSEFDVDKFKQTFKQLVQKSKHAEMIKIITQDESDMEKTMEELKNKIMDIEQKIEKSKTLLECRNGQNHV